MWVNPQNIKNTLRTQTYSATSPLHSNNAHSLADQNQWQDTNSHIFLAVQNLFITAIKFFSSQKQERGLRCPCECSHADVKLHFTSSWCVLLFLACFFYFTSLPLVHFVVLSLLLLLHFTSLGSFVVLDLLLLLHFTISS